ncbi:MAG TPA: class I SAM-dependent methyltransferase [Burkholderiales bacterium]|nr:class I SAM-dependent methyltransferase [Burkholderiales bacterium]
MKLEDFENRLAKNARHWGKWARRRGIECYRVYDRDIPEFAFIVDVYGMRAHLQVYERDSAGISNDESGLLAAIHEVTARVLAMPPEHVVVKHRARRQAGEQHEKTGARGEDFVVHEGGLRFLVNLEAYLDTGLFLDHRNTRAMVAADARVKRMLNLFCYTASFTIYAAQGGAVQSLSLDLSNTYLQWAARNFDLNRLDARAHRLQRADVMQWLSEGGRQECFDLIVLDPPAFSTSKAMSTVLDIQRDHAILLEHCARLLTPHGVLYFSTNLRSFKLQTVPSLLSGEEISSRTVPEDFRNRRVHRCWRFARRG